MEASFLSIYITLASFFFIMDSMATQRKMKFCVHTLLSTQYINLVGTKDREVDILDSFKLLSFQLSNPVLSVVVDPKKNAFFSPHCREELDPT